MSILKKIFNKKSYNIKGCNNRIIIVEENGKEKELKPNKRIPGLEIEIYGSNNIIRIHKPFLTNGSVIKIGNYPEIHNDGSYIELNSTTSFINNKIFAFYGKNQRLFIGKNTTMHDCNIMLVEDSDVYIGEDCMFAGFTTIRGADGHAVFDLATQEIQNVRTSQLQIKNHCWIGESCTILKNAIIPENSIVGAKSLVTRAFQQGGGFLIAGVPASIKKVGISWSRKAPSYFIENKINPLEEISC